MSRYCTNPDCCCVSMGRLGVPWKHRVAGYIEGFSDVMIAGGAWVAFGPRDGVLTFVAMVLWSSFRLRKQEWE